MTIKISRNILRFNVSESWRYDRRKRMTQHKESLFYLVHYLSYRDVD